MWHLIDLALFLWLIWRKNSMGFIESYKHLEKICGDMMGDERRLSAYIDEMKNTRLGKYYVYGWDEDLKALKHYRWVRNQIVHEPGCTEQNMCNEEDVEWLDYFYERILEQTDPLALYHQAINSQNEQQSQFHDTNHKLLPTLLVVCMIVIIILFLVQ